MRAKAFRGFVRSATTLVLMLTMTGCALGLRKGPEPQTLTVVEVW